MPEPLLYARTLEQDFMVVTKGSRNCAECPNPCMPEPPRFPLHSPEWPKRFLFVSVSGVDFHQQEGMG